MEVKRKCFALASLAERFVFATGGLQSSDYVHLQTVERYDIERDTWESVNLLNYARIRHASCAFGDDTLYVFCG